MSKAKRFLRSVRFKFIDSFKRISKCSNCIFLAILLFIAAIVLLLQNNGHESIYIAKLDKFESANYLHHSTNKLLSTGKQNDGRKTTQKAALYETSIISNVTKEVVDPRFPMRIVGKRLPVIKVFYRGKHSLLKNKTAVAQRSSFKKMKFRDIFEAMAHPRLFPTTTDYPPIIPDTHRRDGLNDWIQASNPRDNEKLLVYSAYWDDRFEGSNYVKVIAVMVTKNPATVYCRLQMSDETTNDVPVSRKIMNEHWRLKYASYFLSCEISKNLPVPTKVFLSLNRNFTFSAMLPVYYNKKKTDSPKGDVALCVKPLHYYYDRATWLIEFIELHRILGVEHFFFYNHSVGENVDMLLRHYMKEKLVTVLPWNLPVRSQKDIRTEGIFSSLNDCVLRTMYLYHYVILLDFDEYIIPREHDNYLEMLEKLEDDNKRIRGKPGSFVFKNTFFYLYWENDTAAYGVEPEKPPQWMPYFITQYKTRRLAATMKTGSRSKYIVVPERVIEVGNHVVWRHASGK